MASFMLARESSRMTRQTLFYVQAIDQPLTLLQHATRQDFFTELLRIPSIQKTKRLPAAVLFHQGMRMRFTTTIQQPFVVQEVDCSVVGFGPDDLDTAAQVEVDSKCTSGEYVCTYMPKAIYVKIDDCAHLFLPPAPCPLHRLTGHGTSCLNCRSAVQPGVFAVKPLTRKFKYYYEKSTKFITVQRKQFPFDACPCDATLFDAGHYSRSWHGGVFVLSSALQPNHQMAYSLRHAVSPEKSYVSPVSGPY